MSKLKRGSVAVVGVAESDLGDVGPDRYPIDLAAQASVRALAEAGLTTRDVDAVYAIAGGFMPNLSFGEYMGIRPRISDVTAENGWLTVVFA